MAEHQARDSRTLRRSPLAGLAQQMEEATVTGDRGVSVREIPFLNMVGIRVAQGSDAAAALTETAGVSLPSSHGQVTGNPEGLAILWQGPDEFLLVSPDDTQQAPETEGTASSSEGEGTPGAALTLSTNSFTRELARVMTQHKKRSQVVDLSANRTTIELSGPSARAVLDKGCDLDLHPRAFPPGTAVSATLAHVNVLLWHTHEHTWRIMPRASFAQFIALWLMDAMTEFASQEVA